MSDECPFYDIAPFCGKIMGSVNYPIEKAPGSSSNDRSSDKLDLVELYRLYNDRSGYNSLMYRLEKFQVFANAVVEKDQSRLVIYKPSKDKPTNGWLFSINCLPWFVPIRYEICSPELFQALFKKNRDESFYKLIHLPELEQIGQGYYKIVKTGIIEPEVQNLVPLVVAPAPDFDKTRIQGFSAFKNNEEQPQSSKTNYSPDKYGDLSQQVKDLQEKNQTQEKEIESLRNQVNDLKKENQSLRSEFKKAIESLRSEFKKQIESLRIKDLENKLQQDSIIESNEDQTVTEMTTENTERSNTVVNREETNNDREDHEQTTSTEDSYLTEEEQIICDYYNNFNQLFTYDVQTVQEAKESISEGRIQSSLGAILEVNSDGKYWVFQTSSSIFLVPDRNISLNQYKMQTVRKLFDHNPEAASYRNFWLRKPAKLEVSGNDRWRVIEKGYLEFILE